MSALGLPISLWMVSSRHVEGGAKGTKERSPEFRCETWVSVRNKNIRKSSLGVDVVKEEVGILLGCDGLIGADKTGSFGPHANKGGDGVIGLTIMAQALGKMSDEISGYVAPGTSGNSMGMKEARRGLSRRLGTLTGSTAGGEGADGTCHVRPPEVVSDSVEGLAKTRVSSRRGVMELLKDTLAEDGIIGNTQAIVEIPAVVTVLQELGSSGVVREVQGVLVVGRGDVLEKTIIGDDLSSREDGG